MDRDVIIQLYNEITSLKNDLDEMTTTLEPYTQHPKRVVIEAIDDVMDISHTLSSMELKIQELNFLIDENLT